MNAHLRSPVTHPAERLDQAAISAAFAVARTIDQAEGELLLLQLRARQLRRDIDARSFESPVPIVCATYFHERH